MMKLTTVALCMYRDHTGLRDHFNDQHFLCEEGDCKENIFTAVFRSDIDLKGKRNIISQNITF